jgi:HAD superfamily hydrolase (TIGR01509 family)
MFSVSIVWDGENNIQQQATGYPPVEPAIAIRAVALDMDGLLLNTEDLYQEVSQILMERRGKIYREEVRKKMIGLPAPQAFGVLIEHEALKDTWQELQRETDELFEGMLEERLGTMPGVEELIRAIETTGLPRCVATSSTQSFATKALQHVGILDKLDFVITAEEVGRGKPHPDIYLRAAQRMGIEPHEMLVLEDSDTGTKAGVAANARVVSVPNAHTQHGTFTGAVFIADTLHDHRIYQLLTQRPNLG